MFSKIKSLVTRFKPLISRFKPGLGLVVAVPTLLFSFYYAFWASDVYISEAQFVVRSPDRPSSSPLGSLLQGTAIGRSQDETHTVREYVLSRDALAVLNERINLKAAYASRDVDLFSRFAGLDFDDSFEALHRYYQKKVQVDTDSTSAIVTLKVSAFKAHDAVEANRILLAQSEDLVNRLNQRSRQDLIRFAANEVGLAEKHAKDSALALSSYRTAQNVLDPEKQAAVQMQQVAKLQDELIATTTQLSNLQKFTPENPQIAALKNRSSTLQAEMAKETLRATGGGGASLTNKAAGFQRLALESEFANRQLASALASLESARNEAQRKQVYLERIAQPSLPDVAQEPRRLRSVAATIMLGLVAWGILGMLLAGIREHRD
jgi:capsular polysaccharide transport system permease protein